MGKSTKPTLDIRIEGKNIVKTVPVEKGQKVSIEGTDYAIEIKDFALDYSKRLVPLSEQEPNNPAVMLRSVVLREKILVGRFRSILITRIRLIKQSIRTLSFYVQFLRTFRR